MVFTDGKASDGQCPTGYTCDPNLHPTYRKHLCKRNSDGATLIPGPSGHPCTLELQAPKLKALPDRNQTVSVVAVGFGAVDPKELRFIASSDDNVIMAQGANAAAGLANLKKLLDQLVEKVCNNLPQDCVLEYTPWSACDAPCGPQSQKRKVKRVVTQARNGGNACPSAKAMRKNYYQPCPVKSTCPTTTTPAAKTVRKTVPTTVATKPVNPATTTKPGNSGTSTDADTGNTGSKTSKGTGNGDIKTSTNNSPVTNTKSIDTKVTTDQPGADDNGKGNTREVDGGVPSSVRWTLATACYAAMLFA